MTEVTRATRHDLTCAYDDCPGPQAHPGPERTPNATVHQGEPMMVKVSRQTWSWTCDICGWLGVGLFSPDSAWREAERHMERDHPEVIPDRSEQ